MLVRHGHAEQFSMLGVTSEQLCLGITAIRQPSPVCVMWTSLVLRFASARSSTRNKNCAAGALPQGEGAATQAGLHGQPAPSVQWPHGQYKPASDAPNAPGAPGASGTKRPSQSTSFAPVCAKRSLCTGAFFCPICLRPAAGARPFSPPLCAGDIRSEPVGSAGLHISFL